MDAIAELQSGLNETREDLFSLIQKVKDLEDKVKYLQAQIDMPDWRDRR